MRKRKILFTTGIRSDFYIQDQIIQAVHKHPRLECYLLVTGAHLTKRFGNTMSEIYKRNYKIAGKVKNLIVSDKLSARIKGAAIQLNKMIGIFEKVKPDIVVAPYDREEAITVALAGTYMHIPVAHLGAGDNTDVNVDGIIRHSVTKLAHLSFAATPKSAERVLKMGEEKWRVFVVGSPSIDRFKNIPLLSRDRIGRYFGLNLKGKPLIVNLQHPVSHELRKTKEHIRATLAALDELNYPTVIIHPNSDPGRSAMAAVMQHYHFRNQQVRQRANIPEFYFVNLLRQASVLVGNSSMGIAEAPALRLPVVNVGNRQKGREHADNVIFVPHSKARIIRAVRKCLFDAAFRRKVMRSKNPYGHGATGRKVANILARIKIDERLLNKRMTY